jgi:sulfate transport system substrate-binding protein
VVDKRGTRELATEYLNYLYSDEGQHIAAKNHYRPSNKAILDQYKEFDQNVNLISI